MFEIGIGKDGKINKKIILISIIAIIVIAFIIGTPIFLSGNSNQSEVEENKTAKLYEVLKNKSTYSFTTTLDEDNKMYYAKGQKVAYIDTIYKGEESKFIVRDGNSYLINDEDECYYTYQNNELDLKKIEAQLENVNDLEYIVGKEKINNKQYRYEEYDMETEFLFKYFDNSEINDVKTRFYYEGDNLVYIKTIVGDYEELLKVDIVYNVDSKLFEIPSDYEEA